MLSEDHNCDPGNQQDDHMKLVSQEAVIRFREQIRVGCRD